MRLYLERTVPNFLFADDAADKRQATALFKNDGLHVAVAVWHKLEVVVSWNMAHLVNQQSTIYGTSCRNLAPK